MNIWSNKIKFMSAEGVAQIFNLLYRRIQFGWAFAPQTAPGHRTFGGLQVRDAAECNSALRLKVIGVLTALLLSATFATAAPLKKGDAFPDMTKFGLEGTVPNLAGKVVLVDFFASWCGPCKDSFPAMEALQQKFADKGLVIVAVNLDKKKADMEAFLAKHPASFTIVRDASNKLVKQVKIPTMPSSFLLDKSGKVYSAHRGFKGEETIKEYTEEIETLLK